MEIAIFCVIVQICYIDTTLIKGLPTPYSLWKPNGPLDEGPCRFYFYSKECQSWLQRRNTQAHNQGQRKIQNSQGILSVSTGHREHRLLTYPQPGSSSYFEQRSHGHRIPEIYLSSRKSIPKTQRATGNFKESHINSHVKDKQAKNVVGLHTQMSKVSSMIPMLVKSFENLCFQQPTSSLCPQRSPKVFGPFYVSTKLINDPQGSASGTIRSHIRKNPSSSNSKRKPKIIMAIVSNKQKSGSQPKYDKCSHPFHSWQCRSLSNREHKHFHEPLEVPEKIPNESPRTITKPNPKEKYDKCSHAFHSWQCRYTNSPRRNKDNNFHHSTTTIRTPVTTVPSVKPSLTHIDKCSHPFHSWLCRRNRKPTTTPTTTEKSTYAPTTVTPTTLRPKYMNPCSHSFHSWLCKAVTLAKKTQIKTQEIPLPPTTREPSTLVTKKPLPRVTTQPTIIENTVSIKPDTLGYIEDPCSHSFHSWKCKNKNPPVIVTTEPTTFANFVTPVRTQTTPLENAPSSTILNKTKKPSWKGTNPCSHAFHSWLCKPLHPQLTFKPFNLANTPVTAKQLKEVQPETTTKKAVTEKLIEKTTENPFTTLPTTTLRPVSHKRSQKYKKWDDSCNHSFHSWLCKTFKRTASIVPSHEIPDIRSLPLENEFPTSPITTSESPVSFVSIKFNLDESSLASSNIETFQNPSTSDSSKVYRDKDNENKHPIAKTHTTNSDHDVLSSVTEPSNEKSELPRYKTISFSVPTDPVFKSIPNISLLPLEEAEENTKHISPPSISRPKIVSKRNYEDLTIEDLSVMDYFLDFESQKMNPKRTRI